MKFWTCARCGEPSDYDFCDVCEADMIALYDEMEDIQRELYDEHYKELRQQQSDSATPRKSGP